jgi:hypothetical protein
MQLDGCIEQDTSKEGRALKEKTASDAPSWYSAEEASAWASGYNKALEELGLLKE